MKKSLFMLGLAVAAMTSCSNDELMEVNTNNVISFESHVNNGTRAAVTNDDLTNFFVYGYYEKGGVQTVFNGKEVTKSGSAWGYTDPVAWTGNVYYFGAYATGNTSTTVDGVTFASGVLTIPNYTVNQEQDLVAAVSGKIDNTSLANAAVAMNFKHLLSKVKFTIKNASSENLTMEVSAITFTAKNQGECAFNGTPTWTPTASTTAFTYPATTSNVAQGGTYAPADNLVLPQSTSGLKASFTVKFYNGSTLFDTKEYTNVALNTTVTEWQAGYIYNYTADVAPTMPFIQFTASVTPWENASGGAL